MQAPLPQEAVLFLQRAVQATEVIADLALFFVEQLAAGGQQQAGLQGCQHHHANQQGMYAQGAAGESAYGSGLGRHGQVSEQ
ncbi:hypothetical protein D3C73_1303010 [compost metagenome]